MLPSTITMWPTSSVNIVSPFPRWLHRRTYSLEVLTSLPGRPQQLLHQWYLRLPPWAEESHLQVKAKNSPCPRDRRRWMYVSGVSPSTFAHTSVVWSQKGTWPEHDSAILFTFACLWSLFLSCLILITQKYGSQIGSICVTWDLVRNAGAYAPPQNDWISISISTTCKDDSKFSWGWL